LFSSYFHVILTKTQGERRSGALSIAIVLFIETATPQLLGNIKVSMKSSVFGCSCALITKSWAGVKMGAFDGSIQKAPQLNTTRDHDLITYFSHAV
jgi:hypothetical protein